MQVASYIDNFREEKMKSRIISIIAVVILLSGLSGCIIQPLAEPTAGDRARLRVISDRDGYGYPNRDCLDWSAPGRGSLFALNTIVPVSPANKTIGIPATTSRTYGTMNEFYLEAGKPFSLEFREGRRSRYYCQMAMTLSFVPMLNKDYEAELNVDQTAMTCALSLKIFNESSKAWESIRFTQPQRCKK